MSQQKPHQINGFSTMIDIEGDFGWKLWGSLQGTIHASQRHSLNGMAGWTLVFRISPASSPFSTLAVSCSSCAGAGQVLPKPYDIAFLKWIWSLLLPIYRTTRRSADNSTISGRLPVAARPWVSRAWTSPVSPSLLPGV